MFRVVTFINSVFDSNSYLIYKEDLEECYLIDCGDTKPVLDYIKQHCLHLKAVFLTHTHFDHIYGLNELVEQVPAVTVYTSEFGKMALQSDKLNLSRYNQYSFVFRYVERIRVLGESEIIRICGNMVMEALSTPGHDKGCLTYRIGENVFSGDSFIPGLKVVASFPNSDKLDARTSEQLIREWARGNNLYPGHGRYYIAYYRE